MKKQPKLFFIHLDDSKIEAEIAIDDNSERKNEGIFFIGPDPAHGGNMNNRVINHLFKNLYENDGFSVFRLTVIKRGEEEQHKYIRDVSFSINEFFKLCPELKRLWVVGYSWGALMAIYMVMRRPEVFGFILISPPLTRYNFTASFSACRSRGLVAHGENDSVVPHHIVEKYCKFLNDHRMESKFSLIKKANHYYDEGLETLYGEIKKYIFEHK